MAAPAGPALAQEAPAPEQLAPAPGVEAEAEAATLQAAMSVRSLEDAVERRAVRLGLAPSSARPLMSDPGRIAARGRVLAHVAAFLGDRREVVRVRVPDAAPQRGRRAAPDHPLARHARRLGLDRPPPPRRPIGPADAQRRRDVAGWLAGRRELPREVERRMLRPAPGPLTSPFGPRWGRMHEGIDITGPSGAPIRAAAPGRVTFAGWHGGYGRLVLVAHGEGLSTAYAHMSALSVARGREVARGQVVGRMGTTGHSTGVHLHFEARLDGRAVDPRPYLTRRG